MVDKLNISNEMRAFDCKDRGFYDDLSEEEQRKFAPFLMIRWGATVQGSRELEEYYVIATNQRLNRGFFSVNTTRHKKLQWLMATTVSPDLGTQRHAWIAPKKSQGGKKRRLIEAIYPEANRAELDFLCETITDAEIKQYQKRSGQDQ
jgi:hypothetical protein